jgi:hypothetical protein
MKLSYKIISEHFANETDLALSIYYVHNIVKKHQNIIQKLQDENYNIFSLYLYFDIGDDNKWNDDDNQKLIISASKLTYNTEILNTLTLEYDKYDKLKNEEEMERIYILIDEVIIEHKQILHRHTIILEKTQSFYEVAIKKIKQTIKIY